MTNTQWAEPASEYSKSQGCTCPAKDMIDVDCPLHGVAKPLDAGD